MNFAEYALNEEGGNQNDKKYKYNRYNSSCPFLVLFLPFFLRLFLFRSLFGTASMSTLSKTDLWVTVGVSVAVLALFALFFTRIVFQSALSEHTTWKPSMMQAVRPDINVPFVANAKKFALLAVALIVATVAVTVVRGVAKPSSVFGVDFTGGARVSWSVKPATAQEEAAADAADAIAGDESG